MKQKRAICFLVLAIGFSFMALWLPEESPAKVSGAGGANRPMPAAADPTPAAFLPLVRYVYPSGLSVNPQARQASLEFFRRVYVASEGVGADWTGDHGTCDEGLTSEAFRDAVALRINYFRAMAGVRANVVLSAEYSAKAQKAALMMSANGALSHSPPSDWECWTEEGAEAAGSSNLYLGVYGAEAITGYMYDPGGGNNFAGHRRWILYPQTREMGTGDIPWVTGHAASNALWVFDSNMWGPRPQSREEFVAWPPPGYVPYQVLFPRWSFSYDDADFSSAWVSMSSGGSGISLSVNPVVNGYGENTLVWEPNLTYGTPPAADTVYSVTVHSVVVAGTPRDYAYDVIVYDPEPGRVVALDRSGARRLGEPPQLP